MAEVPHVYAMFFSAFMPKNRVMLRLVSRLTLSPYIPLIKPLFPTAFQKSHARRPMALKIAIALLF
jgi:hypothetical protein